MGVRSSNTTLKDEDDDYAHQIVIGDLERLSMDASVNTAAIAVNTADIAVNTADIATNTAGIATNTTDIATVAADLASLDLSAYAQKASNLSDLTNVVTARTNLGLGSLAVLNTVNNANWSGTALAVANGGTGATTAAAARTNLGLGTAPVDNDILVWDAGSSTYIPGQIVVNRGEIITRNATEIIRLAPGAAGTVLQAAGAAADLFWTNDLILGTDAAGGGTLRVNFAAGKYVEITAAGVVTVFHSAAAKVEINAAARVKINYTNSNTVEIDGSHFVGSSRTVRLREIDVCDAGVARKILILASAAY